MAAALNDLRAQRQSVNKAGTARRKIEGAGFRRAQRILDQRGCRRKSVFRRNGSANDKIDFVRTHTGYF